ncbi:2-methylcitrate dehydratase [Lophiotrema nucula]|uniref:2-methylcitrate dehydratase n=1 Tax=Lophiotrema nucula TaxID=690887 RepID=A0A6A5YQL3_9PLEO|nr:2-methylcitrate dehydratase [Lophiotrema nucula]
MASAVSDVQTEAPVKTNGVNGAVKGTANGIANESITETFVDFAVNTKYEALSSKAISKLKDLIVDHIGVAAGAALGSDSSEPIFKAIQAFSFGVSGNCTVYTKGHNFAPHYAALLNGSFAHSYDFDDTYAAGTVHPGASVIPATLASAELTGASGRDVILAIAIGYEVVCRLSRALGAGSYVRGFHNTATTGLFGSIAAISSLRGLSHQVVTDAMGLAGSRASGSMQFLDNGSWNKRLHPGFAAHDAMLCIALAEQGVTGASRIIEGKVGLLHAFSTSASSDGLTTGLGKDWVFPQTALKPYSACRYTHTGIELVANVAEEARKKAGKDVLPKKIDARLGPAAFGIVGFPQPNKIHPENPVDAQFSNFYQLAIAWLFGSGIGFAAYDAGKFGDPRIRTLCDRINCIKDDQCPVWGTILDFELEDGTKIHKEMAHPLGEEEHPFSPEQVRGKFRGLVDKVYDSSRMEEIIRAVDGIEKAKIADIMKLL